MMLLLVVSLTLALAPAEGVVIQTQYGQLRGIRQQYGNKYIDKFLGIPFALPPVGSKRFQKPVSIQPWTGIRNATQFGFACPQYSKGAATMQHFINVTTNEDCLYLNVYTPEIGPRNASLPVMVFIHGGAFVTGTGSTIDPTQLVLNDVVIVTLDYRLGILGFLSTGDAAAPGNYGMLDQVMALQWVRDCITAFGGNPNRVTIFGESAGAASVSLHLISPLSKGLFHGAIMESGVSLASWASTLTHNAKLVGVRAGCLNSNSTQLVECLRGKTVDELHKASHSMWPPVVEKVYSFLPDTPRRLFDRGLSADVPVIRGITKDELSQNVVKKFGSYHPAPLRDFLTWIHTFVRGRFHRNTNQIEEAIKGVYASSLNPTDLNAVRSSMVKLVSDYFFLAPTVLETQLQANQTRRSPVYLYEFAYRSPNDRLPQWEGVPHGRTLPYVFGNAFHPDAVARWMWHWTWTDQDKAFSRDMMTMWTNFARYGNPTPSAVDGITWQPFTTQSQAYLYIDRPAKVQFNLRAQEVELWNDAIPKLAHQANTIGQGLVGR